jgi:hypothetical protein
MIDSFWNGLRPPLFTISMPGGCRSLLWHSQVQQANQQQPSTVIVVVSSSCERVANRRVFSHSFPAPIGASLLHWALSISVRFVRCVYTHFNSTSATPFILFIKHLIIIRRRQIKKVICHFSSLRQLCVTSRSKSLPYNSAFIIIEIIYLSNSSSSCLHILDAVTEFIYSSALTCFDVNLTGTIVHKNTLHTHSRGK